MSTVRGNRAPRRTPAQRTAEIAATARSLALEEGLSRVTLRAIGLRAGLSPASIAHYIPGMDDLVADTFTTIVADELAQLSRTAERPRPLDWLDRFLAAALDPRRHDVTVVWVEAWALSRSNEPLAVALRAQTAAWQAEIERLIARGVDAGVFEVDDQSLAARQLLGMIDGVNAQSLVLPFPRRDREALLGRAVSGLLGVPPQRAAAR